MSALFEELDYRETPIGALSLRRRRELRLGVDVFEIKLGEDFLMSSLFTASEIALARLGLAGLSGRNLDVVVGGLGLGYTAAAVLEHEEVGSLLVIETLAAVIDWHRSGLVPLGPGLTGDPRCKLIHGDFFALSAAEAGFDPDAPGAASMPCWSTSTIRRTACSIRAVHLSIEPRACAGSPQSCIPAACSACGRTRCPTRPSRRGCAIALRRRAPSR
jgi:hypothetical protein